MAIREFGPQSEWREIGIRLAPVAVGSPYYWMGQMYCTQLFLHLLYSLAVPLLRNMNPMDASDIDPSQTPLQLDFGAP
jgi:hypothetical protein